jgi:hypothetical protein
MPNSSKKYTLYFSFFLLISSCKNTNNEQKIIKKNFDYAGVGYEEQKKVNGLFTFNEGDLWNQNFFFTRYRNDSCKISHNGQILTLKRYKRRLLGNLVEEDYRNDTCNLTFSATPSKEQHISKTCNYNATISLSIAGQVFQENAYGTCDSSELLHK